MRTRLLPGSLRLAAALGLALGTTTWLPAQADEKRAMEAFRIAEEAVARGQYSKAQRAYRAISKQFDGTTTAAVAKRRARPSAYLGHTYLEENGPSSNRLDVVIMGDSFETKELGRFDKWAADLPALFGQRETLGAYRKLHNFSVAHVVSREGDISANGREYDNALGSRTMGENAPWVVVDRSRVQDVLAQVPEHDGFALVLVKAKGLNGTGGGNVAVVSGPDPNTILHEWGHAFGRLGDEYTTYTHPRGDVRAAPNISPTDDRKRVPWAHWLEARAPGVGVYRGGSGRLKGAWRPESTNCLMHNGRTFCRVCREAMVLRIYEFVDPIDSCEPAASKTASTEITPPDDGGSYHFSVDVVVPDEHGLEVRWYVIDEHSAPPARVEGPLTNRKQRGKLAEITVRPEKTYTEVRARTMEFHWTPSKEDAGHRFRVLCRVIDPTPRDGSLPWVLKDEYGLLESERGWWVKP